MASIKISALPESAGGLLAQQVPGVEAGVTVKNSNTLSDTQVVAALGFSPAPLDSPHFINNPQGPTPPIFDNTQSLATTAWVQLQGYITSATAPVTSVAGKTGAVTLVVGDVSGAAPIASPTFTGVPAAPTAAPGTNTTQLATTAFVTAAGFQPGVQYQNQGSNVGTPGSESVVNFTGAGVTASIAGGLLNVNIPGGGLGTVTNFSAGNLAPLFTTSVATASSTPSLTFALSSAAAHSFYGNFTGSATTPGFGNPALASADFANQGTTTTLLHGNAAGNPTWAAVNLAIDVSGNLGVAHLNSGTGASSSTYWRGDGTWATVTGGVSAVTASSPLSSSGGSTPNITHNTSGVTPGTYTNATVTIDADGHVTLAGTGAVGANALLYGDGSDGNVVMDGTNTFAFATLASGIYTLTRDIYTNNLTITGSAHLDTNMYRVFCLTNFDGTGTTAANTSLGAIHCRGYARASAPANSNGISVTGSFGTSQTLNANAGGTGTVTNGGAGASGTVQTASNGGSTHQAGAGGGASSRTGGPGGAGATAVPYIFRRPDADVFYRTSTGAFAFIGPGASGPSGGAGAGNGIASSGPRGGGGGTAGGFLYLAAKNIVLAAGKTLVSVTGVPGGDGGVAITVDMGGGGGGSGGGGGVAHVLFTTTSGTPGAFFDASGATGGIGGLAIGGVGVNGSGGAGGDGGLVLLFNLTAGTTASVSGGVGGAAGAVGVVTPGTGASCVITL